MLLTKHEGQTFQNQTIYISGQAFVRCNFIGCTLVLRETVYYLEGCAFERCNWHVDWVLMWGSPESLREIKGLIALIEQAQQQQLPADQLAASQQGMRVAGPPMPMPPGPLVPNLPPLNLPPEPLVPPNRGGVKTDKKPSAAK